MRVLLSDDNDDTVDELALHRYVERAVRLSRPQIDTSKTRNRTRLQSTTWRSIAVVAAAMLFVGVGLFFAIHIFAASSNSGNIQSPIYGSSVDMPLVDNSNSQTHLKFMRKSPKNIPITATRKMRIWQQEIFV
ncbi:MAG: hypothetical protein JXR76_12495 [Deltaproteobacteria bacterium]|nr:hypothetical protein [Deltaproteobacteria bacterium]